MGESKFATDVLWWVGFVYCLLFGRVRWGGGLNTKFFGYFVDMIMGMIFFFFESFIVVLFAIFL